MANLGVSTDGDITCLDLVELHFRIFCFQFYIIAYELVYSISIHGKDEISL